MAESEEGKIIARLSAMTQKIGGQEPNPERWRLFTFEHWCKMLERHRDLAGKCPSDMLRRVKAELRRRDAAEQKKRNAKLSLAELVEELNREEGPECRQLDPRKDAKRMTGDDWVSFLICNPKEWKLCDFDKLSGSDWVRLICVRRWFYALCNWELFTMDDWCDLLTSRPQFAKLFEQAYAVGGRVGDGL